MSELYRIDFILRNGVAYNSSIFLNIDSVLAVGGHITDLGTTDICLVGVDSGNESIVSGIKLLDFIRDEKIYLQEGWASYRAVVAVSENGYLMSNCIEYIDTVDCTPSLLEQSHSKYDNILNLMSNMNTKYFPKFSKGYSHTSPNLCTFLLDTAWREEPTDYYLKFRHTELSKSAAYQDNVYDYILRNKDYVLFFDNNILGIITVTIDHRSNRFIKFYVNRYGYNPKVLVSLL